MAAVDTYLLMPRRILACWRLSAVEHVRKRASRNLSLSAKTAVNQIYLGLLAWTSLTKAMMSAQ